MSLSHVFVFFAKENSCLLLLIQFSFGGVIFINIVLGFCTDQIKLYVILKATKVFFMKPLQGTYKIIL